MRAHRKSILWLVAGLTVLFNLERIDVGTVNIINIDTFVYVLGAVLVAATLSLPRAARLSSAWIVNLWLGAYLLLKLLVFDHRPLLGGVHTYVTISEITLLCGIAWLSHRLSRGIADFEEAVCDLTLGNLDRRVRSLDTASEEVRRAMLLSRRTARPLSVVVVEPTPGSALATTHRAVVEVQKRMMDRYLVSSMASVIVETVRRTDLTLEKAQDGRVVVVCPETGDTAAAAVADQIQTALSSRLGLSASIGIASFPEAALSFEDLVQRAESRARSSDSSPVPKPSRSEAAVPALGGVPTTGTA